MTTPLPAQQPILLTRGHNVRALLTVLTIMAFLAGLALLFSRATLRLSGDWQSQLSQSLTVQVTLAPLSEENNFDMQMQLATDAVKDIIGEATTVVPLSQSESQNLIRPWIGNLDLPDSVALPGLITIEAPQNVDLPTAQELETQLTEAGIIAVVDDHSRWADQIGGTARALVLGGMALLSLLLIASVSVNLFATRAAMASQRSIISVLAQVGATDSFIAKLFVGQAGRRSALGAGIGLILAWFGWLLLSLLGVSQDIFWPSFTAALSDTLWLFLLWLLFVVFCALTAGVTTQYALRQDRKRA